MDWDPEQTIRRLTQLHDDIRRAVIRARSESMEMDRPIRVEGGDTQYAIDVAVDPMLRTHAETWVNWQPFALIAEGLPEGFLGFPHGVSETEVQRWILIDPIDGTRGLMTDKRPAWALSGVASSQGKRPTLDQIEVAVQSEIPLAKQTEFDVLSAVKGKGAHRVRRSLIHDREVSIPLTPSRAEDLNHGFSCVTMFFPETKVAGAELMKWIVDGLESPREDPLSIFDDQYLSSGGQLYELMAGHDRFIGDFRPQFFQALGKEGLCCHPYDLCTELIARECGVMITDGFGGPLKARFDVESSVSWAGFANQTLARKIEPLIEAWFAK